jgi:hypothetical protein
VEQSSKAFAFLRASRSAALAALVSLAAPARMQAATAPQARAGNPSGTCTKAALADSARVDQYLFKAYQSDEGACLVVTRAGKVVFRAADNGQQYTLGQPGDAVNDIPAIANGTDVTGRGHPDMIVSTFSGGAHCCTSHLVFELEPEFRLLATLNDAHDDLAHFARLGRDRQYFYFTADWTFAYWPDCFACSPSAAVILRFTGDDHGGGFHLALDKMQTPAPTAAEWDKELRAARRSAGESNIDSIGTTLWGPVLNLIYDGHSELAWKFVDAAGPQAQKAPLPTLADFCRLLEKSAYWPDLAPTLRDAPAACSVAAPQK